MIEGNVPITARGRALFLDVDGTLLEMADSPDAVRVPASLKNLLARLDQQEAGGLALVSGRRLTRLDELFAPCRFAAAGLHGLERRNAQGLIVIAAEAALAPPPAFENARATLASLANHHRGLQFEDKGVAFALHYRRAPHLESLVTSQMLSLAAELGPAFHLQPGKYVLELKPRGRTKRTAIEAFMREPPFYGRSPIFVGDDVTDEDGFAAVNRLGGDSIHVGPASATVARWHLESVQHVIEWLERSLLPEPVS